MDLWSYACYRACTTTVLPPGLSLCFCRGCFSVHYRRVLWVHLVLQPVMNGNPQPFAFIIIIIIIIIIETHTNKDVQSKVRKWKRDLITRNNTNNFFK